MVSFTVIKVFHSLFQNMTWLELYNIIELLNAVSKAAYLTKACLIFLFRSFAYFMKWFSLARPQIIPIVNFEFRFAEPRFKPQPINCIEL